MFGLRFSSSTILKQNLVGYADDKSHVEFVGADEASNAQAMLQAEDVVVDALFYATLADVKGKSIFKEADNMLSLINAEDSKSWCNSCSVGGKISFYLMLYYINNICQVYPGQRVADVEADMMAAYQC
ncbi:hypothetical protein COLO4_38553 [Corchorus olitorius]|uniref:Uncharacterized protein n=1 Tax=Corchorus olitorius TaxID=93759 RepID=A0A1R3FUB3_9ROSI|nr:hypothetical protein COLO4_38553 [Corchorus olitorius]